MYVAESGMALGGAPPGGRILRFGANGDHEVLAQGLRPPVNGLVYHFGDLFITEGGHPAQISRLSPDGQRIVILENLPGPGNYHTNTVAFGPDGKLYFSQGAMTNTGVVGTDAYGLAWLRRLPHAHDIPGYDITLRGINFETCDNTWTGAFVPFGHSTTPGQRIARALPSTASVLCCDPDGANLQLVAWGIRNAYGLGFLPDGRLIAIDQGADDRGSRPVGNAPDLLLEIRRGAWYGWPDYIGDIPITDPRFMPERGAAPEFLLSNHDRLPPPEPALLQFPPHVAAVKFDVGPPASPWEGELLVALFGDERPMTAPEGLKAGRCIARILISDWSLSYCKTTPQLMRPIDVRFDSAGRLHVLDFGHFEMGTGNAFTAVAGSGSVWRQIPERV